MQPSFKHQSQKGQIILIALIFFGIFLTISTALIGYVMQYVKAQQFAVGNTQALQLAEAGIDQAAFQLNQDPNYSGETDTAVGNGTFTIVATAIDSKTKSITSTGYIPSSAGPSFTRTVKAVVSISSTEVSFHYGIQAGDGGFTMNNSSNIVGNVFSSGPVIGLSDNLVYGDVVSAGPSGWVYGIHATGTVFSNMIGKTADGTIVDKDAYYKTIVNTTVNGTLHPNSPDQGPVPLPIPDSLINEWESEAVAGGIINTCDGSGNYTVSSSMTLGPVKIACNLIVKSSSAILNVMGPIWVAGNITIQTGPTIKMDSSLGSQNVPIIADNPLNRAGSGIIDVGQSSIFQGSGAVGSFVFLISQNNSAESGGSTVAISMQQGSSALVAYASHGLASLSQSVNVKEVTAYKISLAQSASVTYDTGLPSALFQSGPGGAWVFIPGTYVIVR